MAPRKFDQEIVCRLSDNELLRLQLRVEQELDARLRINPTLRGVRRDWFHAFSELSNKFGFWFPEVIAADQVMGKFPVRFAEGVVDRFEPDDDDQRALIRRFLCGIFLEYIPGARAGVPPTRLMNPMFKAYLEPALAKAFPWQSKNRGMLVMLKGLMTKEVCDGFS